MCSTKSFGSRLQVCVIVKICLQIFILPLLTANGGNPNEECLRWSDSYSLLYENLISLQVDGSKMEDYGTKLKREEMCDDVMTFAEGSGSKAPRCTYGDLAETPRFWAPASMQNAFINAIRKPFQIGIKDVSSTQFRPYWPLLIMCWINPSHILNRRSRAVWHAQQIIQWNLDANFLTINKPSTNNMLRQVLLVLLEWPFALITYIGP